MFIDHFVWMTSDLQLEMERFQEISGVKPEFGGSHPGMGTHNALVRIGDTCYLEIIAPDPLQHQVRRRWIIPEQPTGQRLIKWAWTSTNIQVDSKRMYEISFRMGPVLSGKRSRDDGTWLHWQLTDPDYNDSPLIPFLISWNHDQHPAHSLPHYCQLRSVRIAHPYPATIRFINFLLDFPVIISEGKELVLIEIESPGGVLQLSTQAPYCQIK